MVEVKYVPWGLANRFDTYIELKENLPLYPELHNSILAHELGHSSTPGFTKQDFLLDLGPSKVNYFKLFKFMCIYPKTFLQFAPFYRQKGVWIYDINLMIVWGVLLSAIGLTIGFSI
jgi:hypothetical protein